MPNAGQRQAMTSATLLAVELLWRERLLQLRDCLETAHSSPMVIRCTAPNMRLLLSGLECTQPRSCAVSA